MEKFYIDFDGVILNTIEEFIRISKETNEKDWGIIIRKINLFELYRSGIELNDSIYILKHTISPYSILTKFNTKEELHEKVVYFRENGINADIIGVPLELKKTDIHIPSKDDILIDDQIGNLEDWDNLGGQSILFDQYNQQSGFKKIKRLDEVLKF